MTLSKSQNSIYNNNFQKQSLKMFLNHLRVIKPGSLNVFAQNMGRSFSYGKARKQIEKPDEIQREIDSADTTSNNERQFSEIYATNKVVPILLTKQPVVLSFDAVPGPKSLKYLSNIRHYLSQIGTQITATVLTIGLNIGAYLSERKPIKNLSILFDEYGPVVRFVSPVGGDIVLINHPDYIQKVYTTEGDCPVRSTLESLEKYRTDHRSHIYGGLYSVHGEEWSRQRSVVYTPLNHSCTQHIQGIDDICENFIQKVYAMRTHQDEVPKDLYMEVHKWAFDCMGLIVFSKKFTMLDTEQVYSQCDMSWLYHSLLKATEAIAKCESGLHLWKFFRTPAWNSLVKYCDSLDNLIGKHVIEAEQAISFKSKESIHDDDMTCDSLINSMLLSNYKLTAEDVATIIMDMLLIGVNTVTSSTSFLMYYLAKYQRSQNLLYQEIEGIKDIQLDNIEEMKENTPYLQACIKETLRLVPPIPVLTRILSKNITLDKYNIPRGTLIIMSTQDAALRESNYDDASKFYPERWLRDEAKDYHSFASIPFGFGARRCLGQNIAEMMMSLLTIRVLQKYKLEYHYKDIQPTRSFIARPNRPLKIRFIDRN